MAKNKKSKKKGGKKGKSKGNRLSKHKPGIAESLGLLATGVKVAPVAGPKLVALIKAPSWIGLEGSLRDTWDSVKANAEPAIVGVLVSNADKLPIVGKMIRPLKTKADRIAKSYTGMKV